MMKPMKNKKKLANYMANKYYNRMMRVFNSWKSLSYESQIEYYRQRIGEMGPEI